MANVYSPNSLNVNPVLYEAFMKGETVREQERIKRSEKRKEDKAKEFNPVNAAIDFGVAYVMSGGNPVAAAGAAITSPRGETDIVKSGVQGAGQGSILKSMYEPSAALMPGGSDAVRGTVSALTNPQNLESTATLMASANPDNAVQSLAAAGQINKQKEALRIDKLQKTFDNTLKAGKQVYDKLTPEGQAQWIKKVYQSNPQFQEIAPMEFLDIGNGEWKDYIDAGKTTGETLASDTGAAYRITYDGQGNPIKTDAVTDNKGNPLYRYVPAELTGEKTRASTKTGFEQKQENVQTLPVLQRLSEKKVPASMIEGIKASGDTNAGLERVFANINKIPENKISAVKTAIIKDKLPVLIDPELQGLKTSLEMFIQGLVKENQGSRPSDYDRKVISDAVGNVAAGKLTFEAGLAEVQQILNAKRKNLYNVVLEGYDTDISSIPGYEKFGATNVKTNQFGTWQKNPDGTWSTK
jgi:hypothetical protein